MTPPDDALTDADLAALEWRHAQDYPQVDTCAGCAYPWPCEQHRLLAAVRTLRRELDESRERETALREALKRAIAHIEPTPVSERAIKAARAALGPAS